MFGGLDYILGIKFDGKQASGEAAGVSKSFANIGAVIGRVAGMLGGGILLRGLSRFVSETANWASGINDLGKRMNVSTDKVQEWSYAAKQTGTSIESIANANRYLQIRMAEAQEGIKDSVRAFAWFGLTVKDVKRLKPEELFEEIARRFKLLPESAQKTDAAVTLLGRSADQLFVAFREGFSAATEEARKFGLVIDAETIQKLDAAADKMVTLREQFRYFGVETLTGTTDINTALDRMNGAMLEARKIGFWKLLTTPTIPNIYRILSGGLEAGSAQAGAAPAAVDRGAQVQLLQQQAAALQQIERNTRQTNETVKRVL